MHRLLSRPQGTRREAYRLWPAVSAGPSSIISSTSYIPISIRMASTAITAIGVTAGATARAVPPTVRHLAELVGRLLFVLLLGSRGSGRF